MVVAAGITFEQARAAQANGFEVHMTYVATDDVETSVKRIVGRSRHGGHSASADKIRETYAASLKHFPRAIREFDEVTAYDNTAFAQDPVPVLKAKSGRITYLAKEPPTWLERSLRGTDYETRKLT